MALLTLRNLALNVSNQPLFDDVNISIHQGERIALIGRNGVGKSSLLKLIARVTSPDDGSIEVSAGIKIAYLDQSNFHKISGNVFDIIAKGLGKSGELQIKYENILKKIEENPSDNNLKALANCQQELDAADAWDTKTQIDSILTKMDLDPHADISNLSGGMKRKVLIAQTFVNNPDLILLDEPTNHLDIEAIIWLEKFIIDYGNKYNKSFIVVTHDRKFMQNICTDIIDIDYGKVRKWNGNYHTYLKQKDEALNAEQKEQARFDKRLKEEEVWIRQGIKARRTRNEGRVRALKKMRDERAMRRDRIGNAKISNQTEKKSGKLVFEIKDLGYIYNNNKIIFKNFTTDIMRGEKIGLIGPNGSGKSTLIKCLLNQIQPTQGSVKCGTELQIGYFDQLRAQIDDEKTVAENVGLGSDHLNINGKETHIISYLKDFLFSPERSRSPAKVLSGGEKNRLLLARLFSLPNNLLILDEPTNDLDCETLDLLEEILINYTGTVLLVSHDREFLNNVATSIWVINPDSHEISEYIGGYDDYEKTVISQKKANNNIKQKTSKNLNSNSSSSSNSNSNSLNKSFSNKHKKELEKLPALIEKLESQKQDIYNQLNNPDLYKNNPEKMQSLQQEIDTLDKEIQEKYDRWEELENLNSN